MSDLFKIYTKRMENNKQTKGQIGTPGIPNQDVAYAFVQKLFPDGHLIDVNSNMAWRKNIKYDSTHRLALDE